MMLVVNEWNGRFGNNIIQIINSIEYCFQENLNEIYLPNHEFLKSKHIIINKIDNNNIILYNSLTLYLLNFFIVTFLKMLLILNRSLNIIYL